MSFAPPWSLSPSSVSSFKECPLAFRFSYLERLPEPPAPWTTKGTLVHRALELLLDRPPDERTVDAGLADLARARVELAPHPDFADLDLTERGVGEVRRRRRDAGPQVLPARGPAHRSGPSASSSSSRPTWGPPGSAASSTGSSSTRTGSSSSPTTRPARCRPSSSRRRASAVCTCTRCSVSGCSAGGPRVQLFYLSKPEMIIATPTDQSIRGVERAHHRDVPGDHARPAERDDFRPKPGRLCDFCTFKPYCPAHGGDPVDAAELRGPGTMIARAAPARPRRLTRPRTRPVASADGDAPLRARRRPQRGLPGAHVRPPGRHDDRTPPRPPPRSGLLRAVSAADHGLLWLFVGPRRARGTPRAIPRWRCASARRWASSPR